MLCRMPPAQKAARKLLVWCTVTAHAKDSHGLSGRWMPATYQTTVPLAGNHNMDQVCLVQRVGSQG